MNFEHVLAKYLAHKKYTGCTKSTIRTERIRISRFVKHPVEKWTEIFYRNCANRKRITSKTVLVTLKTFSKWCVQQKYLEENPFKDVSPPKVPKSLPKCLSKEDAAFVLDVASNYSKRTKAVYHTFLYTGMRTAELLNLKTEHINFKENHIFIKDGKGEKDRVIPLHVNLKYVLREWMDLNNTHRVFDVSYSTLRRDLEKVIELSGVKHTFHELRHTYASIAANTPGVNLRTVQKTLGHSSIKTTQIYTHVSADEMLEQVNRVNI